MSSRPTAQRREHHQQRALRSPSVGQTAPPERGEHGDHGQDDEHDLGASPSVKPTALMANRLITAMAVLTGSV